LYARVSTADQNCEMQLRDLRGRADREGWEVAGEYVDTGWSGTKRDRPKLAELFKHAKEKLFDAVVVWKIDRFGRSVVNFIEHLEELRRCRVRFICPDANIDTGQTSPTAQLTMTILIAVAEFEREMIRERTKGGMLTAGKKGIHCGRPKLVLDRRKLRDLISAGLSTRQIAAKLGISVGKAHALVKVFKKGI
jgi:DNA invertase Pin-like site-specific DNA recombinase